ncbi:unnamed protein product [Adineta steineri]|uniref:Uncharacterized protein n=1 Tax=Adineta steineri TaxID=433720 RepID=A0A815NJL4_9BILA|nr:unnamed protein product [Adineta steineri]
MSSFCCSLCPTNRRFDSFARMFQHITLYHQNESDFNITCDLNNACGFLYKTYSAYKAHVYRQHISELHLKNKSNNNSNITSSESEQQEIMNNSSMGLGTNNDDDDILDSVDDYIQATLIDDDCETNIFNSASFFDSINTDESIPELLLMMKRSYMLFILKLREECYITYPEKNLPIPLTQIPTRSMIDHDDLVDKIINDPDRIPLKGVVGPSPLRELIGFHATTSLPRDLMHDLIEGHDVDGSMLKMLNNVERISQLILKLKQQLIFLEEREELFRKVDNGSISYDGSLFNISTISQTQIFTLPNAQISPAVSLNSKSPSSIYLSNTNFSSTMAIDNSTTDEFLTAADAPSFFPDVYEVPVLPKALLKDIEGGNLKSFGPHCQGRQILIDAVIHDLIEKYNLL